MEIDIDLLRRNMVDSFNELADFLKSHAHDALPIPFYQLRIDDYELDDLKKKMNCLRQDILFLAAIYNEDIGLKSIIEEIDLPYFEIEDENGDNEEETQK